MAGSAIDGNTYHLRDRAAHLGLAAQSSGPWATVALGVAQSPHRAHLQLGKSRRPLTARTGWLYLRRHATQETGGLAVVALDASTDQRWLTQLGVLAERRWITPHGDAWMFAQASVRSLWGSRSLHSTQAYQADPGGSFDATDLPITRHVLQLDIGVHAPISRRASATLAYTGQQGGGQLQHGVWLGLAMALDGKLHLDPQN